VKAVKQYPIKVKAVKQYPLKVKAVKQYPIKVKAVKQYPIKVKAVKQYPVKVKAVKQYPIKVKAVKQYPLKVKALKQYPIPKCVRDVRAFVGLASFYRRAVPKFAELAKPQTVLTRKDQKLLWGPLQQQAFGSVKEKLCTAPVLAYLNFRLPFVLTTDASR